MAETFDLIVRGGEVVNHAGRGLADVGITGGKIAAIGDLGQAAPRVVHHLAAAHDQVVGFRHRGSRPWRGWNLCQ